MMRQTLHEDWLLSAADGPVPAEIAGRTVPAQVPGSAHVDLLAADLISDPYLDTVETDLAWAHRTSWRYTLTFQADAPEAGERVDLAFDGLDTVATVHLNGHRLGSTANMHRAYRFDVREALRGGANELTVDFSPALDYAERERERLGHRPHTNTHPYNMVRKMACSFGWDWGPDLQTAGIWKPVRLERWRGARITGVRPLVTVDEQGTGRIEAHVGVERAAADGAATAVTARAAGREVRIDVPEGADEAVAVIEVPDAELWWPAGYGGQPLYDLDLALADAWGTELDRAHRRIGFRTVAVDTAPDEIGARFTVTVNGRSIAVKGANWIPDDHFLTRITRDRLVRRVDQALGAHMNMLRVWGGGIYETDDFYDVCDERGVLVWQDFALACAAYPEEEPLAAEFEAEARENVARLSSHPSLAVWNGGNENLWGFADWGWPEELQGRTWGAHYYYELFPRIVAEVDPTRPYVDGSPCSPGFGPGELHPNDPDHGCRHEWEVWNNVDYTTYRDIVPRFCSEFGFQGPPTWATLTTWIHDEPLAPTSPAFLLHQKANDGNGKLHRGMQGHLPVPADFADWHWATQLNQARAITFGVEHFRSWWPRTAGTLVWQLNDCWPVTSWAAVDGDERPKPLYYALRHAYAPRLLTFQPREGRTALIAVNDTDEAWHGHVHLQRQGFDGAVHEAAKIELAVAARSVARFDPAEPLLAPADPSKELLLAATDDTRTVHLFGEDVDLAYDPEPLSAVAAAVPEGYRVDVRARSFARDVAVLADRAAGDAEADDMLVPMLAGETRSFTVRTAARIDPAQLTGPQVLRCANSLSQQTAGTA
ncbi:glycoside hydrolase family 2 protein [Streptomonospora litoralis]|uniref:beta-mannosidase n=1 Tax=Streptomonospora litoralis TaxID=2498135 RepID=A0A4P6Q928_9ACTN|nr:sugar-binding domain-containing protein [Streptomonospora litoralis]QBI55547.1 Exo-beta-D-glucosaminidase precursor [Streptomonospora litoralis]